MAFIELVSAREKKEFTTSLSIMLKSGMSINDALGIIIRQTPSKNFKKSIERVQKQVEMGNSFAKALQDEERFFGRIASSVVRAGESSGMLSDNLEFLSGWFERSEMLRRETQAALLYPKIIIGVTGVLGIILASFVLPRLIPLFDSLNVELPAATRFLIASIEFAQLYWLALLLGGVGSIIGFFILSKVPQVKLFLHGVYLKVPITGLLVQNYQLALISQILDTLMRGSMSLNDSLAITRDTTTNIKYKQALSAVQNEVQGGGPFSKSLEKFPKLFPLTFTSIIEVGEKTGSLRTSLEHLQEHYSSEVSQLTKRIPQLIEPLLLVIIAFVIGFIAIAIITPLYEVTQGLS